MCSLTIDGVATFLYLLPGANSQSSAGFNADDTEIYTRDGTTLRRFNAEDGSYLGSIGFQGMSAEELEFPAEFQMETNLDGRIFTYAVGVVSEWDLNGVRIGTCTIPIDTPDGFETTWSFAVGGDDQIYLFNENAVKWVSVRSRKPTTRPFGPCLAKLPAHTRLARVGPKLTP